MKFKIFFILSIAWSLSGCKKGSTSLYVMHPPDKTGVDFANTILESDTFNVLTEEYLYNGGGVAAADFNNDGLTDLFFTGNLLSNRMYLNKGEFNFEDVTTVANLQTSGIWSSGVSIVDINHDGWQDIYVCATLYADATRRKNLLYIHEGLNENGIPVFSEQAASYGLDDEGYSMMAGFFDYDRDGDLDVYILTNQRLTGIPTNYRKKMVDGSSPNNDKLYRNNGDNTFTDVSEESGITIEGFGLGLAIADYNMDGWADMYVSNDFLSNDILYINNQDGTFSNHSREYVGHQSQFSMGNDASDVNNDGLSDIITLDMLPETNERKKTTIGGKSYQTYINNEQFGYEYQYVRNMLQLNSGLDQGVGFSEIGQLAGIYQTEWSWSPLLYDADNDGYKDLIITNGFPRDITDKDFANYRAMVNNLATPAIMIDSIPIVKVPNYAYRNNGDLTFTDMANEWGLSQPSFSNGAAFADLDNDGDLDYIVNNINDPAFIYENTLYTAKQRPDSVRWLQIHLEGNGKNRQALGAKVKVVAGDKVQYHEHSLYRGYLSTVASTIHFGLGNNANVDSIIVWWPDGRGQVVTNVGADQRLTLKQEAADRSVASVSDFLFTRKPKPVFEEVGRQAELFYRHEEEDKIDYNLQRTLPHKFSQSGPGLAVGDVTGDGIDDLVVGGSAMFPTKVFVQQHDGSFAEMKNAFPSAKEEEDQGLLLFDADGDRDLDLYVVSGSIEYRPEEPQYQDRLYLNDGKGRFTLATDALPAIRSSGSCVRAADFDGDGDLDLFVGGRVIPGKYPYPAASFLLRNEGGKFNDVTQEVCPELKEGGMITDALWTDYDNDGTTDLVVVGEFMPVVIFRQREGKFQRLSNTGLEKYSGWWNSITGGDFDRDGDTDYLVGNLGLNNSYCATEEFPLKVVAKDFDNNGSVDAILACYLKESLQSSNQKKLFPAHYWDELNSQSPKFRQKFSTYKQFGRTTMDELLSPEEMAGALTLEANHMASSYLENLGDGNFGIRPLPVQAQVAPVNGIVVDDFDGDGFLDALLVGNDFGNEVFVGKFDAMKGLVLLGNGDGHFSVLTSASSGFLVDGDAKALVRLSAADGTPMYIASQNRDSLKVFKPTISKEEIQRIIPGSTSRFAEVIYADGSKEKIEFYFGSGFLSQSSRSRFVSSKAKEIVLPDKEEDGVISSAAD